VQSAIPTGAQQIAKSCQWFGRVILMSIKGPMKLSRATLTLFVCSFIILPATPGGAIPASQTAQQSTRLTPFQLVYLAYQGYFRPQGIPEAGQLLLQYGSPSLTAEALVRAAIAQGRLDAEVLNDSSYLQSVDMEMSTLINLAGDG
jgi:hypothetical protein